MLMKIRKGTPDIMGGLMIGENTIKPASNKTITPESFNAGDIASNTTKEQESIKAINPAGNKASRQEENKTITEVPKEKATFNLSISALEKLDEAWIKMRKSLRGENRITKTLIVEKALELALAEFELKNEKSNLYKLMQDR